MFPDFAAPRIFKSLRTISCISMGAVGFAEFECRSRSRSGFGPRDMLNGIDIVFNMADDA